MSRENASPNPAVRSFSLTASPAILVEPRAVAGRALCQFNQCESLGLWIPQSLAGCCSYGNHGSICDSRPIAISGHPRGTIVGAWPDGPAFFLRLSRDL